jgi:uncharacterized protein (UPF0128 family)
LDEATTLLSFGYVQDKGCAGHENIKVRAVCQPLPSNDRPYAWNQEMGRRLEMGTAFSSALLRTGAALKTTLRENESVLLIDFWTKRIRRSLACGAE